MATELEELIGGIALPEVEETEVVTSQEEADDLEGQEEVESTEQTDDGEETLEPTEGVQPTPQPGQMVPLPAHMEVKHRLRDLEIENRLLRERSELRGEKPPAEQKPAFDEPDPAEVYAKQQAEEHGIEPDEVPIPYAVLKQREEWQGRKQQVTQVETAQQERASALNAAIVEMGDQVLGDGLGIQAVVDLGEKYLTAGDRLDIESAGVNCPKVLYRRCVQRISEANGAEAQVLAQRLALRKQAAPQPRQKAKQPSSPNEPPPAPDVLGRHPTLERLGLTG